VGIVKRQLTEFPEGWALGEPEIATFRKYNPTASDSDIALQWEKFEAHHLSKGSQFKLWSQAWRTWALSATEFAYRQRIGDRNPIGFAHNFGTSGMANLARHLGRGK
jgi:hypothetical protein